MRLLITGASGFIGRYLLRRLRDEPGHQVSGTYHRHRPAENRCRWYRADLEKPEALERVFQETAPEVVVHLAAIGDVGVAERDPDRATRVNAEATEDIARLCAQGRARLVFLSTDYVFRGDRGRYREEEPPDPTTHYGKTKWQAEQIVARHLSSWSVLRTTLVYGWPPSGVHGNFATAVIGALERGAPFHGYTDMYRTPTYVGDVAEGIVRLFDATGQERQQGIYHGAGPQWLNMYDFARTVAQVWGLDTRLVRPASSPPADTGEARPSLLGLDSSRTAARLGLQFSSPVEGLEQMQQERRRYP